VTEETLANTLKVWAMHYNCPDFIDNDPVQFPRKWTEKRDIEISAFITSWLSYGQRAAIIRTATVINNLFVAHQTPIDFILSGKYSQFGNNGRLYRFYTWGDFVDVCEALNQLYADYADMEAMVARHTVNYYHDTIVDYFSPYRVKGIPTSNKSACKRLNMFLRWMIRNDGIVDLGIWKTLNTSNLLIPVDTHVHRIAQKLGITKRKQADRETALEITNYFKRIFSNDPALGDFALFGTGVFES
jgi:uncharacterized protein (TIGR02757 family)